MLDKIGINVDLELGRAMDLIASQLEIVNPEAACEARVLARATKGAIMHVKLDGAQIVCRACDALRDCNRPELVARLETLIRMIKRGRNRKILGNFMMGANLQDILSAAGSKGATLVGIEDPRSNNVVPIARVQ